MPLALQALLGIHRRHPLQAMLMLLGLAISLAVVLALDLAIVSARQAFVDARSALSGGATHSLVALGDSLDEQHYARLRRDGIRAAPILQTSVRWLDGDLPLNLLGIDPLAEATLRPAVLGRSSGVAPSLAADLIGSAAVAISADLSTEFGLRAGDRLRLLIDGTPSSVTIARVLPPRDATRRLILTDIGNTQTLLGLSGRLHRIDLDLAPEQIDPLLTQLPAGVALEATAESDNKVVGMSRAFEINLQALALLMLLIGLFLVYQSIDFLGLRRRGLIALLRTLGVDRRELGRWLLLEAAAIGLIAALLAWLIGIPLSWLLLQGLQHSYSALFYASEGEMVLSFWVLGKSLLLGIGGALLASGPSWLRSVQLPPLQGLRATPSRASGGRRRQHIAWAGLATALAGAAVLAAAPRELLLAYLGLFMVLLGLLSALPALAEWLSTRAALRRATARSVFATLLLSGFGRGLDRTALALAALSLTLASLIGMSSMIDSFRRSVETWIEHSLRADAYLAPSRGSGAIPAELLNRLRTLPGVQDLAYSRRSAIQLPDGQAWLTGFELPARGFSGFELIEGDTETAYQAFRKGAILISEPLARRLNLHAGERLRLPGQQGERSFEIAGVYRDYVSPQGSIAIWLDDYRALRGDLDVGALSIYAQPGQRDAMLSALREWVDAVPSLHLNSADQIRARSLQIFERTFAVTDVLRLLTALIAFCAVLGACAALQLERQTEFGLLRCLGSSPAELRVLEIGQALLLGAVAAAYALPLGSLLATLLTQVIQTRAFGWSMSLYIGAEPLLSAVVLALLAALLAASLASRQLRRLALPRLLRAP